MDKLEKIHERNVFMLKLIWASFFLSLIVTIATNKPLSMIIVLISIAGGACVLLTLFSIKRIFVRETKYLFALILIILGSLSIVGVGIY